MASDAPPSLGNAGVQQPQTPPPPQYTPPTEHVFGNEKRRPFLSPGLFATCPMVCLAQPQEGGRQSFVPLKAVKGKLKMECHIATIFCKYEMKLDGSSLPGGHGVVFLPKHYDATVTNVVVKNLQRDSIYTTALVPRNETGTYSTQSKEQGPLGNIKTDADPELFVLPFGFMKPGDSFKLNISWFQPMAFVQGYYKCTLPLEFPAEMLSPDQTPESILSLECVINTGTDKEVEYKISSHPMKVDEVHEGRITLVGDSDKPWSNNDFVVSYKVWGEETVASMNIQPLDDKDKGGMFALSISPPAPSSATAFQRSIVYVIDRSGSMTGHPVEYARKALLTGLDNLHTNDRFTIIAYDHEQIPWSGRLVDATPDNIENAKQWVLRTVVARGKTDILTPLSQALNILSGSSGVPYVFLLTDGAVRNEREIARYLIERVQYPNRSSVLTPRVSTFGIGPYCNHYFLKQLSTIGRGQFDVAFRPYAIQTQMERMLQAASMPVLTEVSITSSGLNDVELYPSPIPDLFVGLPVLVSGKYSGVFPSTSQLSGRLPNGDLWVKELITTEAVHIPLEQVFAKQRMDIMTASAWLHDDDPRRVQEIVDYSLQTAIPCTHTAMVGIETTESNFNKMEQDKASGKKIKPATYAIGGAAAVAVVAGVGLAIGFGSVASTVANTPVLDALGGGLGNLVGEGLGGAADLVGDGAELVGGFCEECFGQIGDTCGNLCGSIGDGCGNFCEVLGDGCGSFLAVAAETCGQICEGLGELLGELCEGLGDIDF